MTQVQIRMPEEMVENLDKLIRERKFKSRSDAIKSILFLYEEKEKTKKFYEMLEKRSQEAKEKPEELIPLDEV